MAAGKEAGSPHPSAWTRPLRRFFRPFLNDSERERVARAIAEAERRTSGEIAVHIEGRAGDGDILEIARTRFFALGLEKTAQRNAVLILVSDLDHRFAIWGDEGIDRAAGQAFWDKARDALLAHFKERRYADGIVACVHEVGNELAVRFPRRDGPDVNELPDAPTES